MKQERSKKSKLWLWLIAAVAVLVAIGGVFLSLLPKQQTEQPGDSITGADLYWNLDRNQYIEAATGLSARTKDADGMYRMRFAYQGAHVELVVADKQLVNFIDSMDLVALVLGDDGSILNAAEPESVFTVTAKDAFVRKVEKGTLTLNSSQTMNGMEQEVPLTEATGIYDVSVDAAVCGAKADCAIMDMVTVYADAAGNATHVYIKKHPVDADVYWRVGNYYDSVNATTTRVPDENGVYTMLYACNGQQVELKCRDVNLVSRLDSFSAVVSQVALLFDDEGYIIDNTDIAMALRGKYLCQYYTVTAIEGDHVTVERINSGSEQGMVKNFTMGENCDIFMCCTGCHDSHVGERTDHLCVGDTVNVYGDLDGKASLIFVSTRPVESKLYYNLAQQYNSITKETRREPVNGWYTFEMFCEGKTVTVRTNAKDMANQLDSSLAVGLELDGNTVLRTYATRCVTGSNSSANNKYVTSVMGSIFTAAAAGDPTQVNAIMSADCQIYDMTGDFGVAKGTKTTLKLYDRIFAYSDFYGLVSHIFVYSRYAEGTSVYYNVSRKYDTKNQVTTRVPDSDGYYVFDMITEGKKVTVKTQDKAMATFIDAQSAPTVALKVSNGIVKEAHLANMAVKYGSKADNYVYVDKVGKDGTYTTYYYSGETKVPGTVARKLSKNCKIYNVSAAYTKYQGELTTLKPNDRIQAILSAESGEVVMLFVLSREIDSPMYYHVKRMYDTTKAETRRTPDADGWYVFDLLVDGQTKQFRTKDKAVASEVDQFSAPFVMITDGDVILRACNATMHKDVKANAAGQYDVMAIDGSKITLTRNRPLADNYGDTKELTLAANCQVYDVSSYAENLGGKVQLQVGDRVTCYADDNGNISFIFVNYRSTRKAGAVSYCARCKKDVFWNPYTGEIYATDAHYYLPCDTQMSTGKTIGADNEKYSVCIDLNGNSISCKYRPFLVYSELSFLDSAGGGSVVGRCAAEIALGGCITVAGGGTLNLYGGTLTQQAGGIAPGKGGVVNVGYGTTFNMYGGAVKGGYAANQGGNIFVNGSTFNMYGGLVEGGTADLSGGNLCTAANSTINLAGGTIAGDAVIGSGSKVSVSGDMTITKGTAAGLKLSAGDVLTLGTLSEKTSIVISAEGVFTEAKSNISHYQGFFKPFHQADSIQIRDNALVYEKTPVDLNKIDNSDLVFAEGTTKAVCPVCEIEVTWVALTEVRTNMANGGHYYVAEDMTYVGDTNWYLTAPESGAACLHLNGKNITSPTRVIQGNFGVLNVMGNGTVTGNFTDVANLNRGAVMDTTPSKADCAAVTSINLLGGTYQKAEGNTQLSVASIWNNGGRIRMYAGATVKGGIYVGTSDILASELAICGGTVEGLVTFAGSTKNTALLTLSGGNVATVRLPAEASCEVSGAPVVAAMRLAEGAKLTLGELTDGASLTVDASGVFTETKENIAEYMTYFHPASNKIEILEQDGALVCEKVSLNPNELDNSNLVFAAGTTRAVCPLCDMEVTWVALTQKRTNMVNGVHYYVAEDVTYEGGTNWYLTAPESGAACLHLNGKNITSPTRVIQGNFGVLNVMGNGTVTGNYTDTANPARGAVVDTTPSKANCAEVTAINLLGGTYVAAAGNTQENVLSVWDNGGRIRLYGGATVKGGIYAGSSSILASEIDICGGIVEGTVTMTTPAKNTSTLMLVGGNVAAVKLPAGVSCTVFGTPVVGKLEIAEGAKLTLDQLSEGASLTVSATGVFTEPSELANDLLGFFHPVNADDTITPAENVLVYTPAPEPVDPYSGTLELDANGYAVCPVCGGDPVQWTAISGTSVSTGRVGDSKHGHYYLSGDVNLSGAVQNMATARTNSTLCLHLNGKKLTYGSRIAIAYDNSTINVMGSGNVKIIPFTANAANNNAPLYVYKKGTLNLYGGTYTTTDSSRPVLLLNHAEGAVNICGSVSITGGIRVTAGTLTLSGKATADLITLNEQSQLVFGEGWSGTAPWELAQQEG